MRFVDEYRDPAAARAPGRPHHRAGRRRPLQVHGGVRRPHPHHLPARHRARPARAASSWCTGPGCPVCVIPMGRVDDAIAVAETPGVIFTSFGDMMRVPGGNGNLLEAKARGADVRFVYSPLDALRIAVETPRPRRRVLRGRLRDHRAVDRGHAAAGPRRSASPTSSVFCNHVTIVPPIKAILESPDLRLDGFLGPGHVSTVVGNRPVPVRARAVRQAAGDRRLRAARHPPGHRHAAGADPRGPLRGREPVHPGRARRGQPARPAGAGRGVRAAPALRVAGPRASSRRAR